jgi:glycine/D-amino acid oxidase-like deaminating enzyme
MTKTEAKELIKKHGSQRAAARAAKMPLSTFRDFVFGRVKKPRDRRITAATEPKARKTLGDFRASYDKAYIVPRRIKAGLVTLGAGWEYEADFCRSIQISSRDLDAFRDEFAAYIVQVKERRIWSGSKAIAQQMREMV